jgi:hypothetical protein
MNTRKHIFGNWEQTQIYNFYTEEEIKSLYGGVLKYIIIYEYPAEIVDNKSIFAVSRRFDSEQEMFEWVSKNVIGILNLIKPSELHPYYIARIFPEDKAT